MSHETPDFHAPSIEIVIDQAPQETSTKQKRSCIFQQTLDAQKEVVGQIAYRYPEDRERALAMIAVTELSLNTMKSQVNNGDCSKDCGLTSCAIKDWVFMTRHSAVGIMKPEDFAGDLGRGTKIVGGDASNIETPVRPNIGFRLNSTEDGAV